MKNLFKFIFVFFLVSFSAIISAESSQSRYVLVNFSEAMLQVLDGDNVLLETPVVLPKRKFMYPLPVEGEVSVAEMGPVWIPTEKMHRDHPEKYKERYKPYEEGNAMGHCKVSINFYGNKNMDNIRIHGGAKESDLGAKVSRGCIRIPNVACEDLVNLLRVSSGEIAPMVYFSH